METTTTAQGPFGDLSLPFDPIFDPRWQNIYQPAHDASNFDWMHYRTPDDDLSSASSSSDGSYAHSIYSASSDLGNPLNYPLHAPPSVFPSPPYDPFAAAAASASAPTLAPQQQHTASPPPTTTNAPSTTSPAAWASMYTNPYQHDPYQQHQQHQQSHQPSHAHGQGMAQPLTGRDSGEWDSYSSGGEEPYPSYPVPHNPHLQQQHQQPPPNQNQNQQQGMYGAMNLVGDLSASSGGGAGPGGSYSQQHGGPGHPNNPGAKELYASPSPPSANNAYEYEYDSRRVPQQQQQYSASPYPSPTTQPQTQGQGGSRLTPELSQLSIGQQGGQVRYTPGPLSPASQLQQQYAPAPASGSPGPSRTRASGHAQVPYGRPPGHRYASHPQQVQHQHTISGSSGSAPSSSSSQGQGQGQVQYSPTGATAPSGGKIFGTATLPPLPPSNSLPSSNNPIFPVSSNAKSIPPHQHQHQSQLQDQPRKPHKEMVAGTPTHPDIPRPANVAAPVPVPHLTKKSRGRQVPSINSVHSVQSTQSQSQSVQSNSNRRSTGTGSNESRSRERNSYDESRSPLSPSGPGGQMQNAGYFGHPSHPSHLQQQSQYSDDERDFHHAQAQIPHPHRSLFGQPIDEHGSYASGAQGQGAGSASSMSSPATSLSSRRTAERERDPRDELEHGSLPPLSSITGVPSSTQPASNGAPTPGSLEAELRSRPFVCTVEGCGKAYIRAEHLKRHVRSIHTNDKPYECPHPGCGREFSRYDNLCQHFKGVHGPTSGSKNFPSA